MAGHSHVLLRYTKPPKARVWRTGQLRKGVPGFGFCRDAMHRVSHHTRRQFWGVKTTIFRRRDVMHRVSNIQVADLQRKGVEWCWCDGTALRRKELLSMKMHGVHDMRETRCIASLQNHPQALPWKPIAINTNYLVFNIVALSFILALRIVFSFRKAHSTQIKPAWKINKPYRTIKNFL